LLLIVSAGVSIATQAPVAGPSAATTFQVSEGTNLAFDVSADGRSIVFDLLGQLWLMPAAGGAARPITDAVRDTAEDLDPSFAPDARRIAFRGERNGRTGIWLLDVGSGATRQLTQVPHPTGFDGGAAWSPDGRVLVFSRAFPDLSARRWRSDLMVLDIDRDTLRALPIFNPPKGGVADPIWSRDGKQIAFVARDVRRERGGTVWIVSASGGQASPVTSESVQARAPAFSPDGRRLAFFAADADGRNQVWVQEIGASPIKLTDHVDVTATRIRWMPDGQALVYSADGRLWKVSASGGWRSEVPFAATLSLSIPVRVRGTGRFPEPGRPEPARGFMGLSISPEGRQIGILALGKLWVVAVGGGSRAVADVPMSATSLAWSPDGDEVAWSAGVADQEDLFATDVKSGTTRQVTALPGRELAPVYSPDGRYLAFVHAQKDGMLRIVDARAPTVTDAARTRELGAIALNWASRPQWSPASDGVLVPGQANAGEPTRATFVPLSGARETITRFPDAPVFLQWVSDRIVFVRHDRLWQARFDRTGMLTDPQPIGNDAALYLSAFRDGGLLFVSEGGLRLRSPGGTEQRIGWPISYTPPVAEPVLIRNTRIIDGTGGPATAPRDVLLERGRVSRIEPAGTLASGSARVLEAGGRIAIPGLFDLHAHAERPDLLPGSLYFGVTTVRDQGASMASLVAYADAMSAGALPGPRVGYGGFQFYSDWEFDDEQGRGIEPEADPDHIKRAVSLAEAFGAQHIKTRTFRRWDINARMVTEAHRRGMRATGHCAHLLPLVAAGMDAKEHIGLCETRGNSYLYDDLVQLFRVAGIGVVPTISYVDLAVRMNERPETLDDDAELAPFLPGRDAFEWMLKLSAEDRQDWARDVTRAREATLKLSRAGVTVGTGTDIWQIPTGVHMELEQLVAAGLSPAQAIRSATGDAARILGAEKDLGTIEVGKRADLVILDADPLADIRNTRRIWQVIHDGRVIDRAAILSVVRAR
jgi:Tol biopolymer transport system component/imidazolonepropionase-like amidohydrolase